MKKFISLLLVLALVSGAVFAGFSGNASVEAGYNLDDGAWGFTNKKAFGIDVNFLEAIGEKKGEGDIYADVKATLKFYFNNGDNKDLASAGGNTADVIDTFGVEAKLVHAKIVGDGWYVGIKESVDGANFATSAIDSVERDPGKPNKLGYDTAAKDYFADIRSKDFVKKTDGVEIGVSGFVVGLSAKGNAKTDETHVFGSVATPDFAVADGITVKAGAAGFLQKNSTTDKAGGSFSLKGAYDVDGVKASVATDLVYEKTSKFDADVALNVQVAPVALDVYYATVSAYEADAGTEGTAASGVDNLLSAKVVTDLKNFDVPVVVTLTGKDLINKQDLGLKVGVTVAEGLTITPAGGYVINTKVWNAGADVEYKTDAFTAKVGGNYKSTEQLKLNASIESSALVSGATLKLAYEGKDVLQKIATETTDLGKIVASAKIAF